MAGKWVGYWLCRNWKRESGRTAKNNDKKKTVVIEDKVNGESDKTQAKMKEIIGSGSCQSVNKLKQTRETNEKKKQCK